MIRSKNDEYAFQTKYSVVNSSGIVRPLVLLPLPTCICHSPSIFDAANGALAKAVLALPDVSLLTSYHIQLRSAISAQSCTSSDSKCDSEDLERSDGFQESFEGD